MYVFYKVDFFHPHHIKMQQKILSLRNADDLNVSTISLKPKPKSSNAFNIWKNESAP